MANILQFKISLQYIKPLIWRRVQMNDEFTFGQVHLVIQAAMGWKNCHLHSFKVGGRNLGIVSEEFETYDEDENQFVLHQFKLKPGDKLTYEYDFGDGWQHLIAVEEVKAPSSSLPYCLAGKNACPPEDSGGPYRYGEMLKAIEDPSHPDHNLALDWLGPRFDPTKFDLKRANSRLQTLKRSF